MKKIVLVAVAIVAAGCWRARTIPDETLADIFRDMYVANAFVDENAAEFGARRGYNDGYSAYYGGEVMAMDSINIYEPILRHYGYRSRDFLHTLAGFSKRKSAKVGDIIELAIEKLNVELERYTARVEMLDRLDSAAYAFSGDTVARYLSMSAHRVADTARLALDFEALDGHYRIDYNYMLDTLDKNYGLRATHYIRDNAGMTVAQNTYVLFRGSPTHRSFTLNSTPDARTLEIKIGNYMGERLGLPALTVDSILVIHYPPRDETRRRQLEYLLHIEPEVFRRDSFWYEPLH